LTGQAIDFAAWYWTPPPPPQAVIDSEAGRIESQLGLRSLVSLSDHDDISALGAVDVSGRDTVFPISLEWTVPVNGAELHLGVHNLPPERSVDIANDLMARRYIQPAFRMSFVRKIGVALWGHVQTVSS